MLHQWREPWHEEFTPRNVWGLFNALTEALKDGNLAELPKWTEALHGFRIATSASIDPSIGSKGSVSVLFLEVYRGTFL